MSEHEELKATVRSFFQDFLDIREESDSGSVKTIYDGQRMC